MTILPIFKTFEEKVFHLFHYKPPPKGHPLLQRPMLTYSGGVLKASSDLRHLFMAARNQGQEGCCSGFATAGLREAAHALANGQSLPGYLSPAYLYAKARQLEGTFPNDAGATIADELTGLEQYGVCPESLLPYDQDPSELPTAACDVAAQQFRVPIATPVATDASSLKFVLGDQPIVIGFQVYESFESPGPDQNGVVPLPDPTKEALLGGHGVLLVGYDTTGWLVRNQWGPEWGLQGYCIMPFGYERLFTEAYTVGAIP